MPARQNTSPEKRLGARVAELRKRAGLTQERLAERVGTATEIVSRLERGAAIPSFDRLSEIADAMGVELRDLFDFDAPTPTEREATIARIANMLRDRPDADVKLVHDTLRVVFRGPRRKR